MNIASKKKIQRERPTDPMDRAKSFEQDGDLESAAALYEKVIRERPTFEAAYKRLVIIFRKQKELKKEKRLLESAIKAFQQLHSRTLRQPPTAGIRRISRAILKATGLEDRKGRSLYEREPIGSLRKRLEFVKNKLSKK